MSAWTTWHAECRPCGDKIDIAWYPEANESSFSFDTRASKMQFNKLAFVINKLFLK